jgi:hypothetical protein
MLHNNVTNHSTKRSFILHINSLGRSLNSQITITT